MIPQYAERVKRTGRTKLARSREPRMWSRQWLVRQIVYTLIVLAFLAVVGLAGGLQVAG